jgi:hypothetical protein
VVGRSGSQRRDAAAGMRRDNSAQSPCSMCFTKTSGDCMRFHGTASP